MTTRADLVIVGAGLAGAAAAYAAAGRGLDVVVLDRFGPGHKNGSSHGSARIYRRAYPDPLYVRLTGRSGQLWRELEDQAGERLRTPTGGLDFGVARNPGLLHAILTECGVDAELVGEAAAQERWPRFDFTGVGQVMFHADAGVLDPDSAIAAMLRLARGNGADVRFETPATRLQTAPDGAVVHTDSGTFAAPAVIVAAGAWLPSLLGGLANLPPLTVTQQQVFHYPPARSPAAPAPDQGAGPIVAPDLSPAETWPVFICDDGSGFFYGLLGGRDGETPGAVKVAEHDQGTVSTADGRDFRVDPGSRERVRAFVRTRLPGLDSQREINETTCLYTWTSNEDFILDRHGPFVVASPCSGHGAKFAPVIGEILADLASGKPSPDTRFTLAAHRLAAHRLAARRLAARRAAP